MEMECSKRAIIASESDASGIAETPSDRCKQEGSSWDAVFECVGKKEYLCSRRDPVYADGIFGRPERRSSGIRCVNAEWGFWGSPS